jgi:hypothetical protein
VPTVLADPRFLNLLFSGLILLVGLVFYWFLSPTLFKSAAFTERAYEFWLLKWLTYLMTWGLLEKTTDQRWVLAVVDFNNILTIGFFLAFFWGAEYANKKITINLTFLFGLLFSWNFVVSAYLGSINKSGLWITWGIGPSMVAATGSLALVAYVYVRRYGRAGIAFAVASLAYLILQLPAYRMIFNSNVSKSDWLTWLAFGKLFYALAFYASFFSSVPDGTPIKFSQWMQFEEKKPRLRKAFVYVGLGLGSGLLTAVGDFIGKLLLKRFGG